MSQRYLGGIITANPTAPTLTSASGVWTTEQQFQNIANWPKSTGLVSRSVRLRSSASAYFNRTPASAGNRQVMTFSWWMKLGNTTGAIFGVPTTTNPRMQIYYNGPSDGRFELYQSDSGGTQVCYTLTTARYRDPSAWYHFVIAIDTTQATASNRIKWYVNGVQLTAFDTAAYPAQNTNMEWNAAAVHNIGRQPNGGSYFDGYLTEINFIDGQALTPSYFGFTDGNGVWQPATYSGTYGTNGFYLNFSDNSNNTAATIGKDYSGNGNNWTPNNISVTAGATYDSMTDVPTLTSATAANYCTYNSAGSAPSVTLSAANLDASHGAFSSTCGAAGTFGVSSGKWYWEVTINAISSGAPYIGIVRSDQLYPFTTLFANNSQGYAYRATGQKRNNGVDASYGATYAAGDVIGVALDMDAGTLVFYKNNASQGTAYSSLSGVFMPIDANGTSGGTYTSTINFGQRPFTYTPPTGFVALNTQNLPAPTINNGATVMAATTYTGTGSAMSVSNAVNNVSFQPDWLWIKQRNNIANHVLADAIRGVDKYVFSNLTNAEATATAGTGITAFNSNGFSLGTETSTVGSVNAAGGTGTYVAWQWNAGGSTVTNTSGSISAQVRANATAGFSVVTMTYSSVAGTVGHGLGVAPKMIIVKRRDSAGSWYVAHSGLTNMSGYYLLLESTAAQGAASWGGSPTSTVFYMSNSIFASGNYVAYCFAAVAGYSAFGSYTGNGSADGPFVYTGFRPRFVMIRNPAIVANWLMFDSSRDTYNPEVLFIFANTSDAEQNSSASVALDFVSNGFKIRQTSGNINASGNALIYMAFAENPFKLSRAR